MTTLKQTTIASLLALSSLSLISPTIIAASYDNSLNLPQIIDDQDKDNIDDQFETLHGFDATRPYDVWRDLDKDHLPALYENMLNLDTKQADNDVFNNRQLFIISAIADIQGRFASNEEIEQALAQNLTPLEIYQQLLKPKALKQMDFIARAYEILLQRAPDRDGARYYFHQLANPQGLTVNQVIAQILTSKEFEQLHGEDFEQLSFNQWLKAQTQATQTELALVEDQDSALSLSHKAQHIAKAIIQASNNHPNDYYLTDMLVLLLTDKNINQQQVARFSQHLKLDDLAAVLLEIMVSDDFRQARNSQAVDITIDSDNDGRPDAIEFALGFDSQIKDNDVLGKPQHFLQQVMTDITGKALSPRQMKQLLIKLKAAGSKAQWLLTLAPYKDAKANRTWVKQMLLPNGSANQESTIEALLESSAYQARFY